MVISRIQEPIDTMAFDLNRSYPNELTRVGAYELIVDAGARPPIVSRTWGRSFQLVN